MKLFTMEKEGKILAKVASHPKARPIKQKLCDNEQEAQQFFQEVKTTLKQNKKKRNHIKKLFEDMSFQEMAQYVQQEQQSDTQPKFAKHVLKQTIEDANSEIIFFFAEAKEMGVEGAFDYLYSKIGTTFTEMYQNALSGKLDTVYQEV